MLLMNVHSFYMIRVEFHYSPTAIELLSTELIPRCNTLMVGPKPTPIEIKHSTEQFSQPLNTFTVDQIWVHQVKL